MKEKMPSRRDFLKFLGAGVAAASPIKGYGLEKIAEYGKENIPSLLEYEQIPIKEMPDVRFQFYGQTHELPTFTAHYDEYANAMHNADCVLFENTLYAGPQEANSTKYINLPEKDFLRSVKEAGAKEESSGAFFEYMQVLAARLDKPIICAEPNMFYDFDVLDRIGETLDEYAGILKTPKDMGKGAAIAGAGTVIAGSLLNKRGVENAGLSAAIAGAAVNEATGLVKSFDEAVNEKAAELILFSRNFQQETFGKVILEISLLNFRNFAIAAGLHSLYEQRKDLFEHKKISAFYGAAHFDIQQILQLPKSVIDKKLELYRTLVPEIGDERFANIKKFDPVSKEWKILVGQQTQ